MNFSTSSPHDWVEWRRMRALELKQMGWKQRDIAAALGVTEGAVSQWLATARRGGPAALSSRMGRRGSSPRLTPEQLRLIPEFLWHGPEAYGLPGQPWTSKRVAQIIREEFGVSYSSSQVSRLLKQLKWTPQSTVPRDIHRDESIIERWRLEEWPGLKESADRESRTLLFVDESTFEMPSIPSKVLNRERVALLPENWRTRTHLSVVGGLTRSGNLYWMIRPETLNSSLCIDFLGHLLNVAAERLLVIWDRSPIHRRPDIQDFLARQPGASIKIEMLPAYAPELNPMEWLWRHLRQVPPQQDSYIDLDEYKMELEMAFGRLSRRDRLIRSFFAKAQFEL